MILNYVTRITQVKTLDGSSALPGANTRREAEELVSQFKT